MQAARLSELEKLMAKSNAGGISRGQSLDVRSSDEFNKLQEENRVVSELRCLFIHLKLSRLTCSSHRSLRKPWMSCIGKLTNTRTKFEH